MKTPKPTNENLGEWNVFVCEGKTREERKARLMLAPERHRYAIRTHVETVFKLRGNNG